MSPRGRITVTTAAAVTGVPERTIYRWVAEHRLTVVRTGPRRTAMLRPDELDELMSVMRRGVAPGT